MSRTCKTCRWVVDADFYDGAYAKCGAPRNIASKSKSRTGFGEDGEQIVRWKYCATQRLGVSLWPFSWLFSVLGGACGSFGLWWEPKA